MSSPANESTYLQFGVQSQEDLVSTPWYSWRSKWVRGAAALVALSLLAAVTLAVLAVNPEQDQDGEEEARQLMGRVNRESAEWAGKSARAEWAYETDLADERLLKAKLKVAAEAAAFQKKVWGQVVQYPWKTFQDPMLKRQFKMYSILGTAALPEDKRSRLDEIVAEMQKIYSTTKLHEWQPPSADGAERNQSLTEPNIQLEPDLVSIFSSGTNDTCMLEYYWHGWHQKVGREVKPLFEEYVQLSNEAARLNNFSDTSALWNEDFEMRDFEQIVNRLFMQIKPLYEQLHAYARRKLALHLNTPEREVVPPTGFLPAHVLGNVWAQEWGNIYNMTVPYPNKVSVDVTPAMIAQNYTPLKMFKLSEEFYTSLNLSAMTETFWKNTIMEKPKDKEIVCHASAWDFYDGEDFRIKMCTKVNLEDLKTVHHEMGHIQYYQQYKNQPFVFRGGANSGFHEAVGDTLALSVSTAEHLMKIGLLDSNYVEDRENDINSQYLMALEKVAFLPFAYVLDLWRWQIFRGNVTPSEYNCRYWKLRQDFQGIASPLERVEKDFDAGAKYHVIADVPYIRYFVSFIIQFQFHKALCMKAGQYDPKDPSAKPLHQCDIYQSTEAGNTMGDMLQMGSSRHWQDAFEAITGGRKMDAGPLLEYFKPLHDWLIEENSRTGTPVGWDTASHVNACHNALKPEGEESAPADNVCRYTFTEEKQKKEQKVKEEESKQPEEQPKV